MSKYGLKQQKNTSGGKYYWQLQDWVNKLFMKYNRCVICESKKNLEPHHIIQVKPYDKLYADIENGVIMCKSCHRKYHLENDGNINPYTLLLFMKKKVKGKGRSNNAKLKRKLKQSNKALEYYKKETFHLREELNKIGVEKKEEK